MVVEQCAGAGSRNAREAERWRVTPKVWGNMGLHGNFLFPETLFILKFLILHMSVLPANMYVGLPRVCLPLVPEVGCQIP